MNVVGGLKIKDPGLDAAVCLSLASAKANHALNPKLVVCGEVGLLGEVRKVFKQERRRKEVESLGYQMGPAVRELRELLEPVKRVKA